MSKKNAIASVILSIGLFVLSLFVGIPMWIEDDFNKNIRQTPGLTGTIDSVELDVIHGGFVLKGVDVLNILDNGLRHRHYVKSISCSIDWNGIVFGKSSGVQPVVELKDRKLSDSGVENLQSELRFWQQVLGEVSELPIKSAKLEMIKVDLKSTAVFDSNLLWKS
ncbi:MAG: hypothetical protein HRU19_11575 [Pseudobacteriovorax sp.]|nr:hypothetical protein [Pseudobacteriovorax sp.]